MTGLNLEKTNDGVYRLDVRGFARPYPQLFALKALRAIGRGEVLEVITDNPPSCENVPAAASRDGHEVLGVEKIGASVWKIIIRRAR